MNLTISVCSTHFNVTVWTVSQLTSHYFINSLRVQRWTLVRCEFLHPISLAGAFSPALTSLRYQSINVCLSDHSQYQVNIFASLTFACYLRFQSLYKEKEIKSSAIFSGARNQILLEIWCDNFALCWPPFSLQFWNIRCLLFQFYLWRHSSLDIIIFFALPFPVVPHKKQ